jgi:diguanylate cyclase (GGDEF)-like protein
MMDGLVSMPEMALTLAVLDRLMPMHLCLDAQGRVVAAGPTLAKLFPDQPLIGQDLFALFVLRRTGPITSMAAISARLGQLLTLTQRQGSIALRGIALPLANGRGVLMNLSFGNAVLDAVRIYGLTNSDFAPTDLTMELLYLVEANAAVRSELSALNMRLEGAKSAAEEQALTDTLTGLRNRRAMDVALDRMLADSTPFALMHIDLDFFKAVNDTLGHAAGDHVLREAALALSSATRAGDTLARVGGDEFVILLPGQTDAARLRVIADRIIARLEHPIPFGGQMCRISGSIGVALCIAGAKSGATVLQAQADHALYASKRAGRGRATLWQAEAGTPIDGAASLR